MNHLTWLQSGSLGLQVAVENVTDGDHLTEYEKVGNIYGHHIQVYLRLPTA